ncbi:hypothetical protein HID58_066816 [Brassica napus]|uniref:Uncharacterized protein n=1 Tax=Brassica napus TaxID=3708 RepID=A0ABQ7ZGQ6_BRANA|nr:hypothetical protein HID58_066816 [Brassica napus]
MRIKKRGKHLPQMLQRSNASQLTRKGIWRRSEGCFNTRLVVLPPKEGSTRGTFANGNRNHQYRTTKNSRHDSYNPPAKRQTAENPGRRMKANFSVQRPSKAGWRFL